VALTRDAAEGGASQLAAVVRFVAVTLSRAAPVGVGRGGRSKLSLRRGYGLPDTGLAGNHSEAAEGGRR